MLPTLFSAAFCKILNSKTAMRSVRYPIACATAAAGLLHDRPRCFFGRPRDESSPRVVAAVVVFRHGAREPTVELSDREAPPPSFPTIAAAPTHALAVEAVGGHRWDRPPAAPRNRSNRACPPPSTFHLPHPN